MRFLGGVGPAFCAEIAEQAQLAAACGFASGDEIKPAVVVVIDRGDAPAAVPAEIWERHAFEMLTVNVAPKTDAGSARVREGEIHPAIFVEIESDDTYCGGQIFFFEIDRGERSEFSFARIEKDRCAVVAARYNEVDGAVIVKIRGHDAAAGGENAQRCFRADVCERAVAVVPPKNIARPVASRWIDSEEARSVDDVQIEVAVVIVVDPGEATASGFAANANFFGDVFELSVAGVVKEPNAVGEADGEIGVAIVVEITGGATEAGRGALDARQFRDIGELAVADIVEEVTAVRWIAAREEEIRLAVVVVVEEAGAVGGADRRCGRRGNGLRDELRREMNRDGRRRVLHRASGKFSEREAALITVASAEGGGEMLGGHLLKFGEMLFGRLGIATALIGAGQAEFGGGMKRKDRESFLERSYGLIVMLKLRVQVADEIPGVGFVGDLRDVSEGGDTSFRVAQIFVDQAEVVPGVGVLRKFFGGGGESGASELELLLRQKGNAEIEAGDLEIWIGGERLFKELLGVGRALLIHVGDAESIEAVGFGGVVVRCDSLCRRGWSLSGARMKQGCSGAKDG